MGELTSWVGIFLRLLIDLPLKSFPKVNFDVSFTNSISFVGDNSPEDGKIVQLDGKSVRLCGQGSDTTIFHHR